ncbi:alkene reductase [Paraburkholderia hospita]|uniref:alkene reductase n=1 Tax=Paraburkholderia hospita TaxID=169430 RepID=UPI000B346189|nr:alkene reductase [Paraburkholderia hospita]OUL72742.1 alkene reductase [Paraburkholderia hospita]
MSDLFTPYKMGDIQLANRIVMAPMTRSRAPEDVADESTALYYAQRATAGLIVSEGTPISREGQGYLFNPGIYSEAQIAGWKLATDSVRAVGGKIFAQIWHVGRVSHTTIQPDGAAPVSASSKVAQGAVAFGYDENGNPAFVQASEPRPLATQEVGRVVQDFVAASQNAIAAGFTGVEIHAANGYLFEQFMNPLVNDRTDRYSGSFENRLRFTLEVVDAIASRIGAAKVGIRISPYGQLFDMPHYPDILETYEALCAQLGQRGIAYIHIMDQTNFTMAPKDVDASEERTMEMLRRIKAVAGNTSIILAGGMTLERAKELVRDGVIDLAAFGQPFIANPDLVRRLEHGLTLATPDRTTYYGGGLKGYVDYPPHEAH